MSHAQARHRAAHLGGGGGGGGGAVGGGGGAQKHTAPQATRTPTARPSDLARGRRLALPGAARPLAAESANSWLCEEEAAAAAAGPLGGGGELTWGLLESMRLRSYCNDPDVWVEDYRR